MGSRREPVSYAGLRRVPHTHTSELPRNIKMEGEVCRQEVAAYE